MRWSLKQEIASIFIILMTSTIFLNWFINNSFLERYYIENKENVLLCPMIDARRMEVYTAFYTPKLEVKQEISAEIITEGSFDNLLAENPVYFFGNGAAKCAATLTHPNAHFLIDIHPLAKNMIALAERKFEAGDFADVAYYEPFYLKEFQATTPKSLLGQ